ncbi:MAG: adenylate/guanylate cyclase domain-containing protein [Phycisphaerae bacterium]|nr:adenylate/guanylate cyclase domain-containing protein [Phycisphaerae bacterium]
MSDRDRESPAAYLQDRPVLSRSGAWVCVVVGPLATAIIAIWLCNLPGISRLEGATLDWRFQSRSPRSSTTKLVIIEVDEDSRRELKHDGLVFNLREHLAKAIDHLAEAGALVVGLDIWLEDRTTPEVDDALATAIARSNVVVATVYSDGGVIRAADLFLEAGAVEGVISVEPDPGDNVLRRVNPCLFLDVLVDGRLSESSRLAHFPLSLALFAVLDQDDHAAISFSDDRALVGPHQLRAGELVDYVAVKRGGDGDAFRWQTMSLADAVLARFDSKLIDGAIVIIGESRMVSDSFRTPLSSEPTPGIYYHANVVAQILEDRHLDDSWCRPSSAEALAGGSAWAAGILAWIPLVYGRRRGRWIQAAWFAVLSAGLLPGLWIAMAHWAFDQSIVVPMVGPLLGIVVALAVAYGARWILVSMEAGRLAERARRIERLFSRSVSSRVLEAIKANPERIAATEVRDVTILFCDLRDYTRQTYDMPPMRVAAMLNEYYEYITSAVFEEDGFLDKFVGDAMMAVFSAPIEQPDHAARAVRAAMGLKARLLELNAHRTSRGEAALSCGIGLHSGPAALGHVGSAERSNYTVVGATVNLASRIEGHTRGGEILASQALFDRLDPSFQKRARPFGMVELRGATGKHALYEIVIPA